jgi:hypothetical protein
MSVLECTGQDATTGSLAGLGGTQRNRNIVFMCLKQEIVAPGRLERNAMMWQEVYASQCADSRCSVQPVVC